MKTTFDILDALYSLINIDAVNNLISGKIYSNNVPDGNEKENITIDVLTNSNKYLQEGYINLNVHIKEITSGRANLAKFKEIIIAIIPLIDNVHIDSYYFEINDDKGVFENKDMASMFLYNLKIKFQTI
jgi:hypothetical protein